MSWGLGTVSGGIASTKGRAMGGQCVPFLERQHILPCCLLTAHFQAKWELSEYPIKVKIMFNGWVSEESHSTLANNLHVLSPIDKQAIHVTFLVKIHLCSNEYPCGHGVFLHSISVVCAGAMIS